MTFPKWRSSNYKPLESRHKRRHSAGIIRISRKGQRNSVELDLSTSLNGSGSFVSTAREEATTVSVESGLTTSNGETPLSDPLARELSNTPPPAELQARSTARPFRSRSFTVPAWTATLRKGLSLRRRANVASRRLRSSVSPSPERGVSSSTDAAETPDAARDTAGSSEEVAVPDLTDAELDALLQKAWSSVVAAGDVSYMGFIRRKQALDYSRKMAELRQQYQLRVAEIQQREATFVRELLSHDESTPLLRADELTISMELQRAVHEARTSGKFAKLRLELKKETAEAVVALQTRYPTLLRQAREKKRRQLSCHWPSRTLVYHNPHSEPVQSGSMVGIFDGFYATENFDRSEHHTSEPDVDISL